MGWSTKHHGRLPPGVFPGPRDSEAGPGIGHLLETEEPPEPWPVTIDRLGWNRCIGASGPGVLVTVELLPALAVPPGAEVQLWLQYDEERYAEGVFEEYSDADGDLCAVGQVLDRDRLVARGMVYLPWAAAPGIKGDCLCQISVVSGEEILSNEWFEVTLPGPATREVHSAVGALAYVAAAMFGAREPAPAELETAIGELGEIFGLDELGLELARGLLERAVRLKPPFEKALKLVLDEIEPENHREVLRFAGLVSRVRGRAAREDEPFIQRLAVAMGVADSAPAPASADEDPVDKAFRVLELEPDAGLDAVRAAYRRLASDYHPDKVETLAVGFREYATARMQQLNEAYALLKKHLGG